MRIKMQRVAMTVAVSSLFVMAAAPAAAQTTQVQSDITDNEVSFTYDSDSGEMPEETSRRTPRGDEVEFKIVVREGEDAGSGLVGKLKLRLDGDHRLVYDGWFTLSVRDESGDVAFERSRPSNIRLQPRPGMRRAALTFRFDLPSGSYEAAGTFERD